MNDFVYFKQSKMKIFWKNNGMFLTDGKRKDNIERIFLYNKNEDGGNANNANYNNISSNFAQYSLK